MAKEKASDIAAKLRAAATIIEMLGDDPKIGPNVTIGSLVDDYVTLGEVEKTAKKFKELHKTIITARNKEGKKSIIGEKFGININVSERSSLNSEKVKNLLTEEQIAECSNVTSVETWKTFSL